MSPQERVATVAEMLDNDTIRAAYLTPPNTA
jgi:hypothetical protein